MKMTFSYSPGMLKNPAQVTRTSFKRNINFKTVLKVIL